jgi:hypothetical protein
MEAACSTELCYPPAKPRGRFPRGENRASTRFRQCGSHSYRQEAKWQFRNRQCMSCSGSRLFYVDQVRVSVEVLHTTQSADHATRSISPDASHRRCCIHSFMADETFFLIYTFNAPDVSAISSTSLFRRLAIIILTFFVTVLIFDTDSRYKTSHVPVRIQILDFFCIHFQ